MPFSNRTRAERRHADNYLLPRLSLPSPVTASARDTRIYAPDAFRHARARRCAMPTPAAEDAADARAMFHAPRFFASISRLYARMFSPCQTDAHAEAARAAKRPRFAIFICRARRRYLMPPARLIDVPQRLMMPRVTSARREAERRCARRYARRDVEMRAALIRRAASAEFARCRAIWSGAIYGGDVSARRRRLICFISAQTRRAAREAIARGMPIGASGTVMRQRGKRRNGGRPLHDNQRGQMVAGTPRCSQWRC